jgi:hypothetical protein
MFPTNLAAAAASFQLKEPSRGKYNQVIEAECTISANRPQVRPANRGTDVMRKQIMGLVIGAGLVLGGVLLLAYLSDGVRPFRLRRTITVTGAATVRVSPNSARIRFSGLGEVGPTTAEARQKCKEVCNRIEEALGKALQKRKGVKAEVLKTDDMKFWIAPAPEAPGPASAGPAKNARPAGTPPPFDPFDDLRNPFDDLPPAGMPPRQAGRGTVYRVVTFFTVELEMDNADVNVLQQAAREVVDVALQHSAQYKRYPEEPYLELRPPKVTFSCRNSTADRQRALEEALAAARRYAQKLAASDVPVEVLEVNEQVPLSDTETNLTNTHADPLMPKYGGPEPGPGLYAVSGPRTAIDAEITCKVVVKFAF